jgi:hypothetical protein
MYILYFFITILQENFFILMSNLKGFVSEWLQKIYYTQKI